MGPMFRQFPRNFFDPEVTEAFLQDSIELIIRHLGLCSTVSCRLVTSVSWRSLMWKILRRATPCVFTVVPLDPFAYSVTRDGPNTPRSS